MSENKHPFHQLTPDFVMDAVESQGFRCDCRNLTLNSYENRVYQVGIEDAKPLIACTRPSRLAAPHWTGTKSSAPSLRRHTPVRP